MGGVKKANNKSNQKNASKNLANAEADARKQIIEDLFYDFNRSEAQVYRLNFFRGVFFGFGTVLGGTIIIALIIAILGQFAQWFPTISVPVNIITNSLQK